jgi:hypothetical protein
MTRADELGVYSGVYPDRDNKELRRTMRAFLSRNHSKTGNISGS